MSDSDKSRVPEVRKTDVERILEYLTAEEDPDLLSPELEDKLDLFRKIDQWMKRYKPAKVIRMIRRLPGVDISERTAYRYVDAAKRVFNSVSLATDIEFGKRMVLDWLFEARELAMANKDARAMVSATEKLAKLFGIENYDPNAIDPDELKQHQYFTQINYVMMDGQRKTVTIPITRPEKLPEAQREQFVEDLNHIRSQKWDEIESDEDTEATEAAGD